jgi:GNAT superfamily N-acetyltransferase
MLNLIFTALVPAQANGRRPSPVPDRRAARRGDRLCSWGHAGAGVFKLHKLYVLPGRQGRGLGRAILLFIFDVIRPEGATTLRLNVNRANKAKVNSMKK